MIAYNICFSTCLGRVEKFKGTDKFGFTELKVADGLLDLLKDYLTGGFPVPSREHALSLHSDAEWDDLRQACCPQEPSCQNAW